MYIRLLAFLTLLVSCQTAEKSLPDDYLLPTAEISYQEATNELKAQLRLWRGDSLPVARGYEPVSAPTFMDQLMRLRSDQAGMKNELGRYIAHSVMSWPGRFTFRIWPAAADADQQPTDWQAAMSPPRLDSFPATIELDRGLKFPFGSEPLRADERLLLFFETDAWSPGVGRFLVTGPSRDHYARLPPSAMSDLPPGEYELYLIKQRLARDTTNQVRSSTQIEYFSRSIPVVLE